MQRPRYESLLRRSRWARVLPVSLRQGSSRDALTLGGGTAVGQALGAVAAPIITRLYSPDDVGMAGLLITFVAFASVGLSLRYDLATVTAVDESEADILLASSLFLSFAVSAFATGLLGLFIFEGILSFGTLPLSSLGFAFPLLVCVGTFTALRYWYVRRGSFAPISAALVAQGVGRSVVSIALGFLSFGWIGLAFGELAGRGMGMGQLFRDSWPSIRKAANRPWADVRAILKRNRKYPLVVMPSSLLDSAASLLAIPIIIGFFGTVEGGQFFLVQNLLALPGGLVANSVADVLHARFAEAYLANKSDVHPIMRRALARLTTIAVAIYVPIAIAGPFLAGPLLGVQWEHAGVIASILTPLVITSLIVSPASRVLVVVDRPEWKLGVDVGRLVVPAAVLTIAYHAKLGFFSSLLAYSLAMTVTNLIYIFVVFRASRMHLVTSHIV